MFDSEIPPVTIPELPQAGEVALGDQVEICQAGASRSATLGQIAALAPVGTQATYVGAVTAGSFNTPIGGPGYQIGGDTALSRGSYTALYDSKNIPSLVLGNVVDAQNFYRQTTHRFQSPDASVDMVQLTVNEVILYNPTRPGTDNNRNLGHASFRWATVFAGTGAINTSGVDEKRDIVGLNDAERRAAARIKAVGPKRYRLKDAVSEKGDQARFHVGYIAEDVRDALAAEGLDPFAYGMLCLDEVDGSSRFGLRYDELRAFLSGAD